MNRSLRTVKCLLASGLFLNFVGITPPAQAQTAGSNTGCPAGTRESTSNLVRNGTFSTKAGTGNGTATLPAPVPAGLDFTSTLPYRGDSVYPSDNPQLPLDLVYPNPYGGGGLSIQDERLFGGTIPGAPGGVVSGRGVNATEAQRVGIGATPIPTYLYSNPNLDINGNSITSPGAPAPIIWRQTLTVTPNTVYNFKALFFNLLLPTAGGVNPEIRLEIEGASTIGTATPFEVGNPASPVPGFPGIPNVRQAWIPVQFSFTTAPGQTSVELRIVDTAQDTFGDDFGLTAVGLRACLPNIGVAKQASTPVQNADGTFTIPYTVTIENLAPAGSIPDPYVLNNVQLTEDLSTTFANATIVSVGALQSPTLTVNPNFNGTTDTQLLQNNVNSLAAGAQATVSFNVTIIPGTGAGGQGPYQNTVVARATTNTGTQVLDNSNNGTNTDPDNDGDPTNNNTPTVVNLPPAQGQANLILVKRITNVTRNGATLPGVNFGAFVDDPATTNDNNPGWAQLVPPRAPIGAIDIGSNALLQSADEVEYTVYFLSNGGVPSVGTSICDLIPTRTALIPLSNQIRVGAGTPQPGGTVFTPLAPLPANNACLDQRNPNGAIIFDLGTVPNVPANNVGFVRFRVRVD
ncbi:MAG TPA: hypothetical protein V6D29_04645 [Leptolyngbyaceae cyanobacterium]